jgi:hypothetical protein
MKLYATTTSERASKGQGGNEFLDVHFYYEDKNSIIGTITLTLDGKLVFIEGMSNGESIAPEVVLWTKEKGEKQKGERCQICDGEFSNPHFCN